MDRESPKPNPDQELVEVFDTQQESEAMVVQGLLESAGIASILSGLDATQDVLPGVGGVIVRVAPENADEARRLIEEYQTSASTLDADFAEETEPTDEPAA